MSPVPPRREIWIVDDSPTDLERARRALSRLYAVRTFPDGSSMLEELTRAGLPDILVVDWVMAGVSGLDICTYLRSAPRPLVDIPVLILTAQNSMENLVEGLNAGANDYLAKPYAEPEMLARVGALVRQRELFERAEQAQADLRRLLATAPDALLVVDGEGKITFANEEAARISGRPAQSLIGANAGELFPGLMLQNIHPAPGESLLQLPDLQLEARVYSPSLRLLPSDTAGSWILSLRDVTERRQAEERRLDFYSIIAHDLRTPVSSMLLRTDLILRGKHGLLRPELAADIMKLSANARSLVAMINDFLDLARLEGTGYKLERETIDLASELHAWCEDFRPLFETGGINWVDELGPGPVYVLCDRRRIAQVVTNLLGNAIKFTPPGGTVVTRLLDLQDTVEVQIEDSGSGIDPKTAPRLFQRYSRGENETGRAAGTGLGLMIVREVIQAHGGEVGVTSRPGEGSIFWFRIRKAPERTATDFAPLSGDATPAP